MLVYYIHFPGLLPLREFCQVQSSLCVQVLHSPVLAALLHSIQAVGIRKTLQRAEMSIPGKSHSENSRIPGTCSSLDVDHCYFISLANQQQWVVKGPSPAGKTAVAATLAAPTPRLDGYGGTWAIRRALSYWSTMGQMIVSCCVGNIEQKHVMHDCWY